MQKEKTGSKIKPSTSNIVFNILAYSLVAIVSIVCVLPFLLVVSGSFTDNGVIVREGYSLWPKVFSLEAYKVIFKNPASILQAYKMTIYYTVVGTAVGLFMTTMTAYVVSRKEFKYRNIVTFMMYFTTIFGGGMIPWYLLYANVLNLKGTAFVIWFPGHHELISCDPDADIYSEQRAGCDCGICQNRWSGTLYDLYQNRPAGIKARSCNSGIVPGAWLLE